MNELSAKPLPTLTPENTGFWEATKKHELRLQRCSDCGHVRYPVSYVCPECLSYAHEWEKMSGRGSVFASVTIHQVYHPAYKDDVPYNVAMIQLAEGPRMISNVIGCLPDQVAVGDAVEVRFDDVTTEFTIPRFVQAGRDA